MSNKVYVTVGVDKRTIPEGGDAGQFLVKASDEDYDFVWSDVSGTSAERQPSTGVSPKDAYNDTKAGIRGTSVNYARQDHSHPWNVPATGQPAMNGIAAIGDSAYYAAFNHVHPHDTYSTGFTPAGNIILTANTHVFDSIDDLPAAGTAGRIAFVKVS
jgi:hypothetical protein